MNYLQYQRQIGSSNVTAICSAALKDQAEGLLTKLEAINDQGQPLKDGTTIQFGWSLLTLKATDRGLMVCEPDFASDPFNCQVDQVDCTLQVIKEQVALLQFLGIQGVDVSFRDRVIIARDCLQSELIFLNREAPATVNDSGWYIDVLEESKRASGPENWEAIYIYDLLRLRYSLMKTLTLPPEYTVIFQGDNIEAIFNPDQDNIWQN